MSYRDKASNKKRRRRDSSHSKKRKRDRHHRHEKLSPRERRNSSHKSTSSPLRSERSDAVKTGWIEELQRESLQTKANSDLKNKNGIEIDDNSNNQKTWIKKRGLDYLKDEFLKAEYSKENDQYTNLNFLSKISCQTIGKLEKALDLIQLTQFIISELNDYESFNQ